MQNGILYIANTWIVEIMAKNRGWHFMQLPGGTPGGQFYFFEIPKIMFSDQKGT